MKFGVRVLPKPDVLDSQGRAVEKTLSHHQLAVKSCRVGRFVEIEVNEANPDVARQKVQKIAEFVLYNPLTEIYQIEVL